MTPEEAIRTLEEGINYSGEGNPPRFEEACKLGIEALKRLQGLRKMKYVTYFGALPGETKE